jgi:methionine-rich copper-binding protein CopC
MLSPEGRFRPLFARLPHIEHTVPRAKRPAMSAFRILIGAVLVALLSLGRPQATLAHAIVLESVPRAGATVRDTTLEVVIRFSSRIDRSRSHLTLIASDGKERPVEPVAEAAPDLMRATLTGLTPGRYRLRWQVLALDGHITRGDIPFTVAGP